MCVDEGETATHHPSPINSQISVATVKRAENPLTGHLEKNEGGARLLPTPGKGLPRIHHSPEVLGRGTGVGAPFEEIHILNRKCGD